MFQSTPHSMNEANSLIRSRCAIQPPFQSTPHSMNEANARMLEQAAEVMKVSIHASLNE